ncbi:MAG: DUF481 domain-containing protein [Paracoccaceae bacterium]
MNKYMLLAPISALALSVAMPAFAQSDIVGVTAVNDQIDDIEIGVNRDMKRAEDSARFGNGDDNSGFSGSVSLGYSGKSGNTDSQDLTAGLRLRFAQGQLVQTIGAVIDYSELNNVSDTKDVFVVYDANYYLNDSFYVFGLARVKSDGLADTLLADGILPADKYARDAFIGFGPGYRIVNSDAVSWRVQAGIGVSYLEDGLGATTTETGYLLGSRLFFKINDNVFLTNDTDVLDSDTATRINNDFGLNVKLTDVLSTRISYLSEYNDSRAIKTDNKVGVSLVMGF